MKLATTILSTFYHSGSQYTHLCSTCFDEYSKQAPDYWTLESKCLIKRRCAWCKSRERTKALEQGRIIWRVFKDGVYQYETRDRKLAYPKTEWRSYSRGETIIKAGVVCSK